MFRLSKFFSSKVRVRSFSLPPKELGPSPCPLRLVERLEAEGVPPSRAKILTETIMERTAISMKSELDLLRTEFKLNLRQSLKQVDMKVKQAKFNAEKARLDVIIQSTTCLAALFTIMLVFVRLFIMNKKVEENFKFHFKERLQAHLRAP